jgi:hypothetical protein
MQLYRGILFTAAVLAAATACSKRSPDVAELTPAEAREIARDAYVYGFPLVDNYRIQYAYFVNTQDPEYKGAWNEVHNTARVYTPDDKAIQTPNSDTPYSQLGLDLRAEPVVLTVPAIEPGRYYSLQFVDAYTFNYAYAGTRTTGNSGGKFLVSGPDWKGDVPAGLTHIPSETEIAFVLYRTQLYGPDDLENVKRIQAGYDAQPLSAYLGTATPPAAPAVAWMPPLSPAAQRKDPRSFEVLNFVLRFCPPIESERELRSRFAKLGIAPDGNFDVDALRPEIREAVTGGIADAWAALEAITRRIETGEITSADLFGTREYLNGRYDYRMAGAALGIYGNSKAEAFYPAYRVDAKGRPLEGSTRYTLRFPPGELPPANAFWSVTMYDYPSSLLVDNPIDRYLINSPMLPKLKKDPDGGITIHVQNLSPGKGKEANWLPAPAGRFQVAMRIYLPKEEALDGRWKRPELEPVE